MKKILALLCSSVVALVPIALSGCSIPRRDLAELIIINNERIDIHPPIETLGFWTGWTMEYRSNFSSVYYETVTFRITVFALGIDGQDIGYSSRDFTVQWGGSGMIHLTVSTRFEDEPHGFRHVITRA